MRSTTDLRISRTITAGLVVAATATVLAATAHAAEVKLKAASFLPTRIIYAKFFGDWVDEVNNLLDVHPPHRLLFSKGIHLVIPKIETQTPGW